MGRFSIIIEYLTGYLGASLTVALVGLYVVERKYSLAVVIITQALFWFMLGRAEKVVDG